MRRLILSRDKTVAITLCAWGYLAINYFLRPGIWNSYPVWKGTCAVKSLSWDKEEPVLTVDCLNKDRKVVEKNTMIKMLLRGRRQLTCVIAKSGETTCPIEEK